ncbi:MAG: 50S ribosomal protein L17 [Candidatus Marinimicrobia bacterium]|nr:50S ribosomal protein L17 [Candidatus Neomarinimicrobiota bacterium]MCF7840771.1 50S ribosomal protein L17 [Candidatus Neomarinimicrobiota bacterium]
MRHQKRGRKLNRTASHRKAMLANMAANLILHKQIKTTHPKALETRSYIERLITKAKRGDIHARRMVLRKLHRKDVVKILFDEIAPLYQDRNGGYTRIMKLGSRPNDGAAISILSLVDFEGQIAPDESKEETKKTKKSAPKTTKSTEKAAKSELKPEPKAAQEKAESTSDEEPLVEEPEADETKE